MPTPTPSIELKVEQINTLLSEKRDLYNQMISDNQEFEQVKSIFTEIRSLEKSLDQIKKQ